MIYLVTGGSASGKSEYAERLVTAFGGKVRYYLATMQPCDEESQRRIGRHRTMRKNKGFSTVERYTDLAGLELERETFGPEEELEPEKPGSEPKGAEPELKRPGFGPEERKVRCVGREKPTVLLECMSNLVANEMYLPDGAGKQTKSAVVAGVANLARQTEQLVIVTNEVFSDGAEYDAFTAEYLQVLGEINREIAAMADVVVEVVYSIPVIHKGAKYVQFI